MARTLSILRKRFATFSSCSRKTASMLKNPVSWRDDNPASKRIVSRRGTVFVRARIDSEKERRAKSSRSDRGNIELIGDLEFQLIAVQNSESIPARSKATSASRTNSLPIG